MSARGNRAFFIRHVSTTNFIKFQQNLRSHFVFSVLFLIHFTCPRFAKIVNQFFSLTRECKMRRSDLSNLIAFCFFLILQVLRMKDARMSHVEIWQIYLALNYNDPDNKLMTQTIILTMCGVLSCLANPQSLKIQSKKKTKVKNWP